MTELLQCFNKGCGKKYNPKDNNSSACQYHPGGPVFHDALKGWSCCKKRSCDFTEFLNIPGCSHGAHSNEKPEEQEKPKKDPTFEEQLIQQASEPQIIKPEEPHMRPSETEPKVRLPVTVAATLKQALDKQLKDMSLQDSSQSGETRSQEVTVGTSCKNNTCKKSYVNEDDNTEVCIYHPGVPIFHEGMKFWSCCQRKTSEFDNFLNQEGCTEGRHVWIKKDEGKKVDCRYDWHQTASFITLSLFAKVSQPDSSWVEANQVSADVHITFDGGRNVFDKSILLRGVIDPSKSSVKMLGAKVEINLRKAEPGSWVSLEMPAERRDRTNEPDQEEDVENIS